MVKIFDESLEERAPRRSLMWRVNEVLRVLHPAALERHGNGLTALDAAIALVTGGTANRRQLGTFQARSRHRHR